MQAYPSEDNKELIKAISFLQTEKEITSFIRDLFSHNDIDELSNRFQIAKLLWTTQFSYIQISQKVGASTATVTRVSQWLYKEPWQGLATILEKMFGKSKR